MKKIDQYLEELQLPNIDSRIIMELIVVILGFALNIWFYYISSKRNIHIETILKKITGRKYYVRILKGVKEPNAFCFGGLGSSIFVTEGLIKIMTEREVIAVCLHESGHITNYDTITSGIISLASLGFSHILLTSCFKVLTKSTGGPAKIICGIILVMIIVLIAKETPVLLLGKLHEYNADKNSSKYGYGKDLISALEKLEKWVKEYKFKIYGEPTKFEKLITKIDQFLDVHPTTKHRIKQLLKNEEFYKNIYNKDIYKIKKLCKLTLSNQHNL
jgi:Zn-dependent protease with chaperone function